MNFFAAIIDLFRNTPSIPASPSQPIDLAQVLLEVHNDERIARGIARLRLRDKLSLAATEHAQWMYDTKQISNIGLAGDSVLNRIESQEYYARSIGENIANGYTSVSSVMSAWMASSGHRRNILGNYMDVGFGRVDNYWCTIFAIPGTNQKDDTVTINYSGPLSAPKCG